MAQFQGHTDGISAIAVDPDGAWLASGDTGLAQRGDVRIWRGFRRTSSAAQMPQHPMSGDKRNIAGLAVTSDGAWVASTADSPSRADEIRVWAAADGSHRRTFPGLFHRRCYLEFSPDGSMLAASGIGPNGRDVVRVWEVSSGRLRHEFRDVAQGFPRLLVTGDGSTLYGVFDRSRPARIHAWDMLSGRERLLHIESSDCISAFAISADGKRIAAGGRRSSLRTDQTPDVHVWSSEVPELLHVLPGRGHDISAIAMIASTNLLAAADAPHRAASEVRLWDLETGRLAEIFDGHTRPVRTLVAAPDGSWLASVGNEFFDPEGYGGELCVWDVATGRLRWKLADIHGTISGLVNSPDGSHILAAVTRPGAGGGEIRVWQTATGEASASLRVAGAIGGVRWTERSILIGGEKGVYCLAFGEFGSEQTSGDR